MNKWIIASDAILLSIDTFFLYFGLSLYLFPKARGSLQGGAAAASSGAVIAVLGLLVILLGIASKQEIEVSSKGKTANFS